MTTNWNLLNGIVANSINAVQEFCHYKNVNQDFTSMKNHKFVITLQIHHVICHVIKQLQVLLHHQLHLLLHPQVQPLLHVEKEVFMSHVKLMLMWSLMAIAGIYYRKLHNYGIFLISPIFSSQYYMCLPENCYYPASCNPLFRFDPDWANQDLDEMYCKDPCLVSGCVSILV